MRYSYVGVVYVHVFFTHFLSPQLRFNGNPHYASPSPSEIVPSPSANSPPPFVKRKELDECRLLGQTNICERIQRGREGRAKTVLSRELSSYEAETFDKVPPIFPIYVYTQQRPNKDISFVETHTRLIIAVDICSSGSQSVRTAWMAERDRKCHFRD